MRLVRWVSERAANRGTGGGGGDKEAKKNKGRGAQEKKEKATNANPQNKRSAFGVFELPMPRNCPKT
jgi:hypothetical protein